MNAFKLNKVINYKDTNYKKTRAILNLKYRLDTINFLIIKHKICRVHTMSASNREGSPAMLPDIWFMLNNWTYIQEADQQKGNQTVA